MCGMLIPWWVTNMICHARMGMEISVHTGHSWVLRWSQAWFISLYINWSIEIINNQGATAKYAGIGMLVQFVRRLSYFTWHICNDTGCSCRYRLSKYHNTYGGHYSHADIRGCSDIFIVGRLIFHFLVLFVFWVPPWQTWFLLSLVSSPPPSKWEWELSDR